MLLSGLVFCQLLCGCTTTENKVMDELEASLQVIADSAPGKVGIAFISDGGDTILINNNDRYPLMSVFKLHQAIAVCNYMEHHNVSADSTFNISRSALNSSTWSPMLMDYTGDTISISFRGLMRYALVQSDNNASNYMFDHLLLISAVDSVVSNIIPREEFKLTYTEAEMQQQHARAYDNYSTPIGAAMLIDRLYTDSTLFCSDNMKFLCDFLEECVTGADRISAPLIGRSGVIVGHKTGSGYRDGDILVAHNDVAFVRLPDNKHYTLSVFIKDFTGTEAEASAIIAQISAAVYERVCSVSD